MKIYAILVEAGSYSDYTCRYLPKAFVRKEDAEEFIRKAEARNKEICDAREKAGKPWSVANWRSGYKLTPEEQAAYEAARALRNEFDEAAFPDDAIYNICELELIE